MVKLYGLPVVGMTGLLGEIESEAAREASLRGATFWLEAGFAIAGPEFVWGCGEIEYQGGRYAFRISGLSAGDIDPIGVSISGKVSGLRKLCDFSGNYLLSAVAPTAAGREMEICLRNERGVMILTMSTSCGRRVFLPADGMRVRLKS